MQNFLDIQLNFLQNWYQILFYQTLETHNLKPKSFLDTCIVYLSKYIDLLIYFHNLLNKL